MICPHCQSEFEARRADQVYCRQRCRQDHYTATVGDGGLRAAISSVRVLSRGNVSVVLRFKLVDRDNALRLMPGKVVEVVES